MPGSAVLRQALDCIALAANTHSHGGHLPRAGFEPGPISVVRQFCAFDAERPLLRLDR
jgi:hypothetical protein